MTIAWRVLESTHLYAGLGLQLLDDHTGLPIETAAKVVLEMQAGATWRALDLEPQTLPGAVFFFPRLERYSYASGRPPRVYRVRASSDYYWPLTRLLGGTTSIPVFAWDDENPPAQTLAFAQPVRMVPRPAAPFGLTPVFRGRVLTVPPVSVPIARAIVAYDQPQPAAPPRRLRVESEDDGEYALPIRRIATANLTLLVTVAGVTTPFPIPGWRMAARTTRNLSL